MTSEAGTVDPPPVPPDVALALAVLLRRSQHPGHALTVQVVRLTPRELTIASRIASGASIVQISRDIGSSVATVRAHVRTIAKKLPNPHGLPAARLIRHYMLFLVN